MEFENKITLLTLEIERLFNKTNSQEENENKLRNNLEKMIQKLNISESIYKEQEFKLGEENKILKNKIIENEENIIEYESYLKDNKFLSF